jgi:ParB family chromosome partitioning protein
MSESRLGRRLSDLLGSKGPLEAVPSETTFPKAKEATPTDVPVSQVDANPFQPRADFDKSQLEELKKSILSTGILQPIVVRPAGERYQVVVGERRLRAAKELGLERIPAVVRQAGDGELLELALIENVQRADLNPIEKAKAYRRLMQEFGLTQEQVAQRVGQERSTVANFVRLLELPKEVQDHVSRGTISMGHARALLTIADGAKQRELADRVAKEGVSVRDVERLIARGEAPRKRASRGEKSPQVRSLEDKLKRHFGTRVSIFEGRNRGRLVIEFYGTDDFDRLMQIMGVGTGD